MQCPTCGANKKLHSEQLWKHHQRMYEDYKKVLKIQEKRRKTYNAKYGTN